jgi:uncharacterized membrane protein YccC
MRYARALEHRVRTALRTVLSSYVLSGVSAAVGLFVIAQTVHLFLGPFAGATATVGVIACVPMDQPAPRRRKLRQLLPGAFICLPLFFAVQWLSEQPVYLGLLIVPASFVAFLCAAWGKRGIPLSVSAMFAIIFSMAVPGHEAHASALTTTSYFALGFGAYMLFATASNALLNPRYRVQMLADTLLAVSALMRTQARAFVPLVHDDQVPVEPIGQLIRKQAALADQMQGARDIILESPRTKRRQQIAGMLLSLLEMRDHLLACELDVETLVAHPVHAPVLGALREMLDRLAREIEQVADCLLTGRKPIAYPSQRARLATLQWATDDAVPAEPGRPSPAMLARGVADRVGHIDDETLRLIGVARGDIAPDLALVRQSWQMFVSPTTWSIRPFTALWHWDAPPLRHAIRAALAIATGYVVALSLPWGTHPYWVLLTITVVLRGSFAQTIERRNHRVMGTLVGSVVAGVVILLSRSPLALVLVVAGAQGVAHAFAIRRYVIAAIAATVLALTQAHALNLTVSPVFEALERIVDTLIGTGLAWAFSYVLPSWERTQIPVLVKRTLEAHARHARFALALGQFDAVDNAPGLEWRLARREAYDSLSALVQATQRSLSEPRAVRPPLEPLGHLLSHSYQFLAQLTAAKTMLLVRRDRLDPAKLAAPLQDAGDSIGNVLTTAPAPIEAVEDRTIGLREPLALPDPFQHDLSPWLLRRLELATALATQVRSDAERVLRA